MTQSADMMVILPGGKGLQHFFHHKDHQEMAQRAQGRIVIFVYFPCGLCVEENVYLSVFYKSDATHEKYIQFEV